MAMEQSILKSTKTMLDVAPDDESFDAQIIGHINAVLSDLLDLGIGPVEGLVVEDDTVEWSALFTDQFQAGRIKNLVYLKVRILWDPPQTSFLLDAHQKQIDEAVWRIVNKLDGDRYVSEEVSNG